MKKGLWVLTAVLLCCAVVFAGGEAEALSPETEILLKLLEKKGIITKSEVDALRREVQAAVEPATEREAMKAQIKEELKEELKAEGGALAAIQDRITISGALDVDYQYKDHRQSHVK